MLLGASRVSLRFSTACFVHVLCMGTEKGSVPTGLVTENCPILSRDIGKDNATILQVKHNPQYLQRRLIFTG